MGTVDKDALRALIAKFSAEQNEARASLATIANLSGARPGEPMRDMTEWFRARVKSEIGCLQEAINLVESLLNA